MRMCLQIMKCEGCSKNISIPKFRLKIDELAANDLKNSFVQLLQIFMDFLIR